jgi:polyphosphate kinase
MKDQDIGVHYPYQSFDYIFVLLREASIDPKVTSIKITVYRAAKNSSVMNTLINAARNGKSVFVVLELQARFDEEANISWANRLQDEGVRVIFGVPGLKVHSKLCLITAEKPGQKLRYAVIGTGNFNEDTAKVYCDHHLFTVDKRITEEVSSVFDFYERNYRTSTFKHLAVSPFNLRARLAKLIGREIENAREGKESYIYIKVNNLVDPEIILQLYQASEAGVTIRLIVRSMFSLMPGVKGISQNIKAISIVDRYLEHTRLFIFCNNGEPKYFISSADVMQRNLDRRVEVMCPIYSREIREELKTYFDLQWQDGVKSRWLTKKLDNRYRRKQDVQPVRAQWAIYDYLKKKYTG